MNINIFIIHSIDEYWECCIHRIASSLQHQVGTCKMGIDPDAVVDPELRGAYSFICLNSLNYLVNLRL